MPHIKPFENIVLRLVLTLVVGSCFVTNEIASANPSKPQGSDNDIQQFLRTESASVHELYKNLHRQPELSFQEKETSAILAKELSNSGYTVSEGIGGYGVVGLLRNGEGPTVMLRTDMDALPILEKTGAEYASSITAFEDRGEKNPSKETAVMHACGHDIHMASFIATTRLLAKTKTKWSGTLLAVAQPAEEKGAGARAMLKDGLFKKFPTPDYAVALHVDPHLATGKVRWVKGYTTANVDSVDILVRGVGGHGAHPDKAKDPVLLAAQIVVALQSIVSREINPIQPAVVTVGSIHGGTKHNVIPDEVRLQLTVRSYADDVRAQLLAAIRRIAKGVAQTAGLPEELYPVVTQPKNRYTPSGFNDPKLVERAISVWNETIGAENVLEGEASMGGEDFALYARESKKTSGMLFRLGSVAAKKIAAAKNSRALPSLHSNRYLPEYKKTLETGVITTYSLIYDILKRE